MSIYLLHFGMLVFSAWSRAARSLTLIPLNSPIRPIPLFLVGSILLYTLPELFSGLLLFAEADVGGLYSVLFKLWCTPCIMAGNLTVKKIKRKHYK